MRCTRQIARPWKELLKSHRRVTLCTALTVTWAISSPRHKNSMTVGKARGLFALDWYGTTPLPDEDADYWRRRHYATPRSREERPLRGSRGSRAAIQVRKRKRHFARPSLGIELDSPLRSGRPTIRRSVCWSIEFRVPRARSTGSLYRADSNQQYDWFTLQTKIRGSLLRTGLQNCSRDTNKWFIKHHYYIDDS